MNLKRSLLSAFFLSGQVLVGQTITYDFNGQWNGDWDTYHVQTGGAAATPSMNYSKASEGRSSGASGNILAGNVEANGYQGSLTSIYTPGGTTTTGVQNLSTTGSQLRLQGSYSAFASQPSFTGGSSEVGQVGLISAPSFTDAADSTLKLGDSVYLGFIERSWTGQVTGPPAGPGSAVVELALFQDGSIAQSFGTFSMSDYGARIGNEVYSQFFEYDLLFENLPNGSLGYKVGVNSVSFYDDNLFTSPDPTEGSVVSLGTWEGSLNSAGGLNDLTDLRVAYGAYVAPDGLASVTGYTFDHSPTGDIHDGLISIPEPTVFALLGLSALALVRRRR